MTAKNRAGIWTAGIIGIGTIWALVWPYLKDMLCNLFCS